ncbi:multicomponent K+:H+ antiporter subunit G [Devosia crocina]|uniref:Multicomponent K+:H+ antiporter subunit G n=1 Tax=Devosia crocina TaxID=429728 RepID=A0A1I7NUR2_9HYPH|nr:monovalent cation/H(+) antiporter subunit G [Devosia crocina]SFV38406.1 multicomponent K+:H+ antiporter subunit G [Devosia crocina]
MSPDLPLWLAILVSLFVFLGALLTMAGCLGLVRLKTFYLRIHAPTMGTSMGGGLILLASAIYFSITRERPIFHEIIIFAFVTVTTPVTLMLLARATLFRDRVEGSAEIPQRDA